MSQRTNQRKSWRIRYSLRTFLLVFMLVSIVLSVWFALVEPVRKQWRAAAPLLELGATVESETTGWPEWVTWILPKGQSQNVIAVHFNRNAVNQQSLDALQQLPHLRRLYMERAGVNDKHLAEIAKLNTIRRIALWGNQVTDRGVGQLVEMPALEFVDLSADTTVTWRIHSAFRNRPEVTVRTWSDATGIFDLKGEEVDQLASLGMDVLHPGIEWVNDEQIATAIKSFEKLKSLRIIGDNCQVTSKGLNAIRACRNCRQVVMKFETNSNDSLTTMIKNACAVWGKSTSHIALSRHEGLFDFHLIGLGSQRSAPSQHVYFRMMNGPPESNVFAELEGLGQVPTLNCHEELDPHTLRIVRAMPNLRHLELSWFRGLSESCHRIIAEIDSLESIKFDGPTYEYDAKLPVDFFADLACRDTLKHVVICNIGITREHVLPLLEYPRLETLKIDDRQFESERLDPKDWLPELRTGGL